MLRLINISWWKKIDSNGTIYEQQVSVTYFWLVKWESLKDLELGVGVGFPEIPHLSIWIFFRPSSFIIYPMGPPYEFLSS